MKILHKNRIRNAKKLKADNCNLEAGFTLIELVFVFVIFAIMSSIVLFNFRGFNARVQFDNLAQDIALQIVQAQKAAINGATNINFTGQSVRPSYGVYFVSGPGSGTAEKQFTYFNDLPVGTATVGDKMYAEDGCIHAPPFLGQECLSVTSVTTGEYISAIRYKAVGASLGTALPSGGRAHIAFTRPFPDAVLTVQIGAGGTPTPAQSVCVELSSADATLKKTISVSNLGAIRTVAGSVATSTSPCY